MSNAWSSSYGTLTIGENDMRDLQIETTWYLPCSCGQYCTIWERVYEGEEYYDEDMGGEQYHVATGEVISDEDLCTRELILRNGFVRILEDHTGLKADCELPADLYIALAQLLEWSEHNEFSNEPDYDTCLGITDRDGGVVVLDQGFLYVHGQNDLSIEVNDSLFGAFQQAFIAHGAEVLKEEE